MIRVVSFTDENMTKSANLLNESARKFGADDVAIYQLADLDPFFVRNILFPLLEGSRGVGWWIWKPYIMLSHALVACKDEDILVYSDAGQEIVAPLQPIIDGMGEGDDIRLFTNGFQHSHWCKKEVALAINNFYFDESKEYPTDPDRIIYRESDYYQHKQVQASFIFFRINDKTRAFIQEWYAYSLMPGFIDNTPRGYQFPEFAEHRHDQAILTCLAIRDEIKQHWFPSTTNLHQGPNGENYGVTVLHHRKRNHEW